MLWIPLDEMVGKREFEDRVSPPGSKKEGTPGATHPPPPPMVPLIKARVL